MKSKLLNFNSPYNIKKYEIKNNEIIIYYEDGNMEYVPYSIQNLDATIDRIRVQLDGMKKNNQHIKFGFIISILMMLTLGIFIIKIPIFILLYLVLGKLIINMKSQMYTYKKEIKTLETFVEEQLNLKDSLSKNGDIFVNVNNNISDKNFDKTNNYDYLNMDYIREELKKIKQDIQNVSPKEDINNLKVEMDKKPKVRFYNKF